MLAAGDLASIAELCKAIGNEVTDDSGFVPVRHLLSRFHAELAIRPLLVEAMLASASGSNNRSQWIVLVDSETYPFSAHDVEEERQTRPLPHRMRNSIAHELVHSLAFRSSEFGIRLKARTDTTRSLRELVEAIEAETERLSPLLLWSEKALEMLLQAKQETLSLFDLLRVLESAGISRYVLIGRLRLIRLDTDSNRFLYSAGLRNLAVGLGVWGARNAYIKGWPLFANFDNGIFPSFLHKIPEHDLLPAETIFSDERFAMLGGASNTIELETSAGVKDAPHAKQMKVRIDVEEGLRRQGEEFLFVVHRVSRSKPTLPRA
jgi:hypothetical protein